MSLLETLQQRLGPDAVSQLSRRIDAEPGATGNAVDSALPLLIAALARNAADRAGAQSLSAAVGEHDGSLLDNLPLYLTSGDSADGAAIVQHLLGNRKQAVETAVGRITGLSAGKMAQLLPLLAPIVMAGLGRLARRQSLGPDGLSTMLRDEHQHLQQSAPGALATLSALLDRNHDGSVIDDVGGILGSVFGGKH